MNYGFHRVIKPKGVVPQAAWKVDNTPQKLHPTEKLIKVKLLNLDSTSLRQIKESGRDIKKRVWEIIKERGKMHNPVTNSGGVLLGEYQGQAIVPWVSLSAIPLHLTKIRGWHGQQLDVDGTAVLFESYLYTPVPKDMDWRLAATALDIASLAVQVKRVIQKQRGRKFKALIMGCGNAGIVAMAIIKKYAPQAKILGMDVDSRNFKKIKKFGYTDKLAKIDGVNAGMVIKFANNCDLVVNCVNVPNTEAASVLAAKDRGLVMFFSMATQFDKASLATDATGKDVTMIVASGIAKNEDKEIFALLKENPQLLHVFHA